MVIFELDIITQSMEKSIHRSERTKKKKFNGLFPPSPATPLPRKGKANVYRWSRCMISGLKSYRKSPMMNLGFVYPVLRKEKQEHIFLVNSSKFKLMKVKLK